MVIRQDTTLLKKNITFSTLDFGFQCGYSKADSPVLFNYNRIIRRNRYGKVLANKNHGKFLNKGPKVKGLNACLQCNGACMRCTNGQTGFKKIFPIYEKIHKSNNSVCKSIFSLSHTFFYKTIILY